MCSAIASASRILDLLSPRSIAVIGAVDRPGNLGAAAMANLTRFGFPGPVWAVHPGAQPVAGCPSFASVQHLPTPADLAVLAVSAARLPEAVRQCAAAGIQLGIAWAGGFAETGPQGQHLQQLLVEACRETGFLLCGPNCIGIVNAELPMMATFGSALLDRDSVPRGGISIVSQSGGIATFVQMLAAEAGFGCRYVISSGNEAVLTTADYLRALADDDGTRVICIYSEGVTDGQAFLEAVGAARRAGKQVVMLKAGAIPASAAAALAHTGALAGEDRVWDAVLREHGVTRVRSLEEMVDVALLASGLGVEAPAAHGVGIVTFGGGGGVLCTDQCGAHDLAVPSLEPARAAALRTLVPPIASIANPFDLTPDAYNRPEWLAKFPDALAAIASDPAIDVLIFQLGAIAHKAREVIDQILLLREQTTKPILVAWPLASDLVRQALPAAGVPVFPDSARALRAAATLLRPKPALALRPAARRPPADVSAIGLTDGAAEVVPEHRCHALLRAAGLAVVAGEVVTDRTQLGQALERLSFPVVLKGLSERVTHRAATGLVILRIANAQEAEAAFEALHKRAASQGVTLDGVYVQHMVPSGAELIVSAFRDPVFGVMISCGAGGNQAELIDDTALASAPLDEARAAALFHRLRIARHAPKLHGALREMDVIDWLVRFSEFAAALPWAEFVLEVNPIVWTTEGVVAVDGLIVLPRSSPAPQSPECLE